MHFSVLETRERMHSLGFLHSLSGLCAHPRGAPPCTLNGSARRHSTHLPALPCPWFLQGLVVGPTLGQVTKWMHHSPWDGLTVADLLLPILVYCVGVSSALAFQVCRWRTFLSFGSTASKSPPG